MKTIFLATLLFSTAAFAGSSNDSLNSAVVDGVIEAHQQAVDSQLLLSFPDTLVCDGNQLSGIRTAQIEADGSLPGSSCSLQTDLAKETLLVNCSDGDQVGGFLMMTADLRALSSGKVTSIPVKEFGGFWWADGSHYSLFDAKCSLK